MASIPLSGSDDLQKPSSISAVLDIHEMSGSSFYQKNYSRVQIPLLKLVYLQYHDDWDSLCSKPEKNKLRQKAHQLRD